MDLTFRPILPSETVGILSRIPGPLCPFWGLGKGSMRFSLPGLVPKACAGHQLHSCLWPYAYKPVTDRTRCGSNKALTVLRQRFPAPGFKVVSASRAQAGASPLLAPLTSTDALQSKDRGQLCGSLPRAPPGSLCFGVQTPQSYIQPLGQGHAHCGQSSIWAPRGGN